MYLPYNKIIMAVASGAFIWQGAIFLSHAEIISGLACLILGTILLLKARFF